MSNFEERINNILEFRMDPKILQAADREKKTLEKMNKLPASKTIGLPKQKQDEINKSMKASDDAENIVAMQVAQNEIDKKAKRGEKGMVMQADIHDEITDAINEYFDGLYE